MLVWTTHKEYLVVFVTSKFGRNLCSSLRDMHNILRVELDNAYSRPKMFFGVTPKMESVSTRPPNGTPLHRNTSYPLYDV